MLFNKVNRKVYVGQTRQRTLKARWNQHLSSRSNSILRWAINKYGEEAFSRRILARCSSQIEMDHLERQWILMLQVLRPSLRLQLDDGRTGVARYRNQGHQAPHLRGHEVNVAEEDSRPDEAVCQGHASDHAPCMAGENRSRESGSRSKDQPSLNGPEDWLDVEQGTHPRA